ncbi:MAG: Uma2 family endonuclease [Deltaproteobacteria bacterium]|nr:Uma2 family endonuclease [Deltaproteobacteria bacterium]
MGTTLDRLPPGPLTYEDYVELPDDGKRYEVLGGELFVSPAPAPRHQMVSANLEWQLALHVRRRRLGRILHAPIDLILSPTTIAQPDVLFIRSGHESIVTGRAIEGAPDLVVEILSPSTGRKDRTTKALLYARFRVAHYWIIDPDERTVELYELDGEAYRLVSKEGGETIVRPSLFPGLEIDLGELWA